MNQLQCPNCGGEMIAVAPNQYRCKYCKKESVINDNNELIFALNLGAKLRYRKDFDGAIEEYERAIEIDNTCAGAYWGKFLSEYGLEFVKDTDGSYKPTLCHRLQTTPATESSSFKKALDYATGTEKTDYQELCSSIEKVRKQLVAKTSNMQPYDIFICYKQNEEGTQTRTKESELAKELYYRLKGLGYEVFFAEQSMADKKGEYEANIFSALNSAKIMLVLAGSVDHVNAVWVKNEWSRFVRLAMDDPTKSLKVICQDMNPEDLPTALKKEQAILVKDLDWYDKLRTFIKNSLLTQTKQSSVSDIAKKRFDEFEQYRKNAVIARERAETLKTPEQVLEEKEIKRIIAEHSSVLRNGTLSESEIYILREIYTELNPFIKKYFEAARLQLITQLSIVLNCPITDEKQMLDHPVDISKWESYEGVLNTCTEEDKEYFQKLCETSKRNFDAEQRLTPIRKMIEQNMFDEALPYATNIANEYPMYQHVWAVILLCKNKCTSYESLFAKTGTSLLKTEEYKNIEKCLFDKDANCLKPAIKNKVIAVSRSNHTMLRIIDRLQYVKKERQIDIEETKRKLKIRRVLCSVFGIILFICIAIAVLCFLGVFNIPFKIAIPLIVIPSFIITIIPPLIAIRNGKNPYRPSRKYILRKACEPLDLSSFLEREDKNLINLLKNADATNYSTGKKEAVLEQIDRLIQTLTKAINKNKTYIDYFVAHNVIKKASLDSLKEDAKTIIEDIESCVCKGYVSNGPFFMFHPWKVSLIIDELSIAEGQETYMYSPKFKTIIPVDQEGNLVNEEKLFLGDQACKKIEEAIEVYKKQKK